MASDPSNKEPPTASAHHKSSSTDIFSSAKVLAEAAKSSFGRDGGAPVDKAKVAEAAEEVIDAASEYGKLREKGYGSYVDKADGYLHQQHSSDQKPTHSSPPREENPTPEKKLTVPDKDSSPEEKSTLPVKDSTPEEPKPDSGLGNYINKIGGFLK